MYGGCVSDHWVVVVNVLPFWRLITGGIQLTNFGFVSSTVSCSAPSYASAVATNSWLRVVSLLVKAMTYGRVFQLASIFKVGISGLSLEKALVKLVFQDIFVLVSDMFMHKLCTSEAFTTNITLVLLAFLDLLAFVNTELVFHFIQDLILIWVNQELSTSLDNLVSCSNIHLLELNSLAVLRV